jgi:serine/threonine-protein kinase RsbT
MTLFEYTYDIKDELSLKMALINISKDLIQLEFCLIKASSIQTAISEMGRNILKFADHGEVSLRNITKCKKEGIEIHVIDKGPGIADIEQAMQEGYSTQKTLGLGLSGSRNLMDEFYIESQLGKGTSVRMVMWK